MPFLLKSHKNSNQKNVSVYIKNNLFNLLRTIQHIIYDMFLKKMECRIRTTFVQEVIFYKCFNVHMNLFLRGFIAAAIFCDISDH